MKKIIALLLSLVLCFTCMLALASCGECEHLDENGDGKCDNCDEAYEAPDKGLKATLAAYANSQPTKVVTTSKQAFWEFDDEGEKFVAYDLDSETVLVTGKVNGLTATVETTTREILRAIGETDDILGAITTTVATDEYLEGYGRRVNAADGNDWQAGGLNFAPRLGSIAIGITADNVKNATYTEAAYNNVYTFTVAKADVEAVFGEEITTDTDVTVTIVNDGAVVTSITMTYGVNAVDNYPERTVTISATYDYSVQKVSLVK